MTETPICTAVRSAIKDVSLVIRERTDSLSQWIFGEWAYYVARARLWESWREFSEMEAEARYAGEDIGSPQHLFAEEDYLRVLQTARLERLADKLKVLMPAREVGDFYRKLEWDNDHSQPMYLTDKGMSEVLPKIREAAREHREGMGYWLSIGIGFIGAVTGLVAVLN